MLSEPTYLAARMVAPALENHFVQHLAAARRVGAELAPVPSAALMEAVIDVAFWASLRREEGRPPRISLVLLPPNEAAGPLVFGHRPRLTPQALIKLAPAVEYPGVHLGVWHDADGLYLWGAATRIPPVCFVLEVVEPGLLVVKHRRADGFGKFVNVAVLRGDQIRVVDEENAGLADCPALLASLPGIPAPTGVDAPLDVLVELSSAMRAHGRGGLVLVVPHGSMQWQKSIVQPLSYPVVPAYVGIAAALSRPAPEGLEAALRAIEIVGGFTAVDGATVITQNIRVAGLWGQGDASGRQHARGRVSGNRTCSGQHCHAHASGPKRRHAPLGCRSVCVRPAQCPGLGSLAGRQFHGIRVVGKSEFSPCPPHRRAAALRRLFGAGLGPVPMGRYQLLREDW